MIHSHPNDKICKLLSEHVTKDPKRATFYSFAGGKWEFDLTNDQVRNDFVAAFEDSVMWERALSGFRDVRSEEISVVHTSANKENYLIDVHPKGESIFYADIDKFVCLDDLATKIPFEQVINNAIIWTDRLCVQKTKLIVFTSTKNILQKDEDGLPSTIQQTNLHFYWPEMVIESIEIREMLAKDLQESLNVEVDLSVYKSGLRLPGCFKADGSTFFYSWYPCDSTTPPSLDEILLTPRKNHFRVGLNQNILLEIFQKYSVLGKKSTKKAQKSQKAQNRMGEYVDSEKTEIKTDWSSDIPNAVLNDLPSLTTFKPPYRIKGKGRLKNTWFVDYDRTNTKKCCHGQHHDSWKFLLYHDPETKKISVCCLKPECKSKGWVCVRPGDHSTSDATQIDIVDNEIETFPENNEEGFQPLIFSNFASLLKQKKFEDALNLLNNYVARIGNPAGYVQRITVDDWCINSKELISNLFKNYRVEIDAEEYKRLTLRTYTDPRERSCGSSEDSSSDCESSSEESTRKRKKNRKHKTSKRGRPPSKTYIKTIFEIWDEWIDARMFIQLVFDPTLPPRGGTKEKPSHYLNLYQGLACKPSCLSLEELQKTIQPIHDQIFYGFANGNEDNADYLFNILAHIVQRPHIKTGIGIIIQSEQGAGKNIVFDLLKKIFGVHLIAVDNLKAIFESYNDHIVHGIVLLFDEVIYGNSCKEAQQMKKLVTGHEMEYRKKYVSITSVKNLANCFILSNHLKVLHMEAGCRRYAVFRVPANRRIPLRGYMKGQLKQTTHFTDIGQVPPEAFLQFLLERDIENFDPRDIPNTPERIKMIKSCFDKIQQWIMHLIEDDEELNWFERTDLFATDVWHSFKSYMNITNQYTKFDFFHEIERYGIHKFRSRTPMAHGGKFLQRPHCVSFPSKRFIKDQMMSVLNIKDPNLKESIVFGDE
jgi:hypothetical protein